MVVRVIDVVCVATAHAVHRYRRRFNHPRATPEDVADVMRSCEFRKGAPHGVHLEPNPDVFGYLVLDRMVFPVLRRDSGDLVAVTCMKATRRSKADRRAYREMMRGMF